MSSAPNFIFTVSPNFFICDGPNVSIVENCGILRLDPNHFQQLSDIIAESTDKLDLKYEFP